MPATDPVVADTSPLLNLTLVDRLDLVDEQFETIHVPEQVWDELTAGDEDVPGLRALRDAGTLTVVPVDRSDLYTEIAHELDVGETAAITYAIENDANLVRLDERDGRQVARRHDLDVTGAIGILLRGAREGTVDLRAELDALRDAGFWIPTTSTTRFSADTKTTSSDGRRRPSRGDSPQRGHPDRPSLRGGSHSDLLAERSDCIVDDVRCQRTDGRHDVGFRDDSRVSRIDVALLRKTPDRPVVGGDRDTPFDLGRRYSEHDMLIRVCRARIVTDDDERAVVRIKQRRMSDDLTSQVVRGHLTLDGLLATLPSRPRRLSPRPSRPRPSRRGRPWISTWRAST